MSITISIDSVTTADADPTVAPHRISDKPGKQTATVRFTPVTSDGSDILGYRVRVGGVDYDSGLPAGGAGLFPSTDLNADDNAVASTWSSPSGTQLAEAVDYSEVQSPGTLQVNVWAYSKTQGWST